MMGEHCQHTQLLAGSLNTRGAEGAEAASVRGSYFAMNFLKKHTQLWCTMMEWL
jgi:hypothetical protein